MKNAKGIGVGDVVVAPKGINRKKWDPHYENDPPGSEYKVLAIVFGDDNFQYGDILVEGLLDGDRCDELPPEQFQYNLELYEEDPDVVKVLIYCRNHGLRTWWCNFDELELKGKKL